MLTVTRSEYRREEDRNRMRVLLAYEETHRAYRMVICRAIKAERPHFEVRSVGVSTIEGELNRFEPHVVICSCSSRDYPGGRAAWLEMPIEPSQWSDVCLGGDHEKDLNPGISKVLSFLDEAEEGLRMGTLNEDC
jgi:hypothetical protein